MRFAKPVDVMRIILSLLFPILFHALVFGEDYEVTASASVYVGEDIIGQLPKGTKFTSEQVNSEWVLYEYLGADGSRKGGWISTKELKVISDSNPKQIVAATKDEIYLYSNGERNGPYKPDQVASFLDNNFITLEDYGWHEGLDSWVQLKNIDLKAPEREEIITSDNTGSPPHVKKTIYVYDKGMEFGPYSNEEVKVMLETGAIKLDDRARFVDEKDRVKLRDIYSSTGITSSKPATVAKATTAKPKKKGTAKKFFAGFGKILGAGLVGAGKAIENSNKTSNNYAYQPVQSNYNYQPQSNIYGTSSTDFAQTYAIANAQQYGTTNTYQYGNPQANKINRAILNGNQYDPNSLSNPYGAGSPYKADGLMNPYSKYGSEYSNKSWTNQYATDAPKLYDQNGKYLGKLSSNPYDPESTSNPYGKYGSKYSADSINNPYGAGNPYTNNKIYVEGQ